MRGQTLYQQEMIEAVEKGILDTPRAKYLRGRIIDREDRKSKRAKGKEEESDEEMEELEELHKQLKEANQKVQKYEKLLDHHNILY